MQRLWFGELSAYRVPAGKPHHGRVVHAGTEVVLVDLGVVPLAGKFEGIGDILDPLALVELPVRRIGGAVKRPNNHPALLKALPLQRGSTAGRGYYFLRRRRPPKIKRQSTSSIQTYDFFKEQKTYQHQQSVYSIAYVFSQ
jgi:hypothetical protein